MKSFMLAAVLCLFTTVSFGAEFTGSVSNDALSDIGLGQMEQMSEEDAQAIRGQGLKVVVTRQFLEIALDQPISKADFKAGTSQITAALDAQLQAQFNLSLADLKKLKGVTIITTGNAVRVRVSNAGAKNIRVALGL